jgi:hypothetical protein
MEQIIKAVDSHKKRKRASNAEDTASQAVKRVKSEEIVSTAGGSEVGSESAKKKARRGNRKNYQLNKLKRKQLALQTGGEDASVKVEGEVQLKEEGSVGTPKEENTALQEEQLTVASPDNQKKVKKQKHSKPGACPLPNHEGHLEKDCYVLHPGITPKTSRKSIKKQERKEKFIAQHTEELNDRKKRKDEGLAPPEKKSKEERQLTKRRRREKREREAKEAADIKPQELHLVKLEDDARSDSDEVDDIPVPVAASHGGSWKTSQPAGGRFLDHDPVFSIDER